MQRILEIPERAGTVNGVLQIVAEPFRLDGLGELAHDLPLVDIEFRGQLLKPIPIGEHRLGYLELVFLPFEYVVNRAAFFRNPQHFPRHRLHFSGLAIHVVKALVGRHLQSFDDVL